MPEFFQTAIGRRFYEHTMPELVRQLARINELLERLVAAQEQPPADAGRTNPSTPNHKEKQP